MTQTSQKVVMKLYAAGEDMRGRRLSCALGGEEKGPQSLLSPIPPPTSHLLLVHSLSFFFSPSLPLQLSSSLFPFPASGKLSGHKACTDVLRLLSPDLSSVATHFYLSTYVSTSSGLSPSFPLSLTPSLPPASVPHREYTSGCSPTCFIALLTAYH